MWTCLYEVTLEIVCHLSVLCLPLTWEQRKLAIVIADEIDLRSKDQGQGHGFNLLLPLSLIHI